MKSIWTMGEMIVEIMRAKSEVPHSTPGEYLGPYASGAPAIMISAAARMGVPAGIIGGVGRDAFGDVIVDRLTGCGVDCSHVNRSANAATGSAFVMYHDDGSREFIFHINGTAAVDVPVPALDRVAAPGYFHVMGCSLTVTPEFCQKIVDTALQFAAHGAEISFDPNIRPELLRDDNFSVIVAPILSNCSVLMPGVSELLMLSKKPGVEEAVDYLFAQYPSLKLITLKNGSKGSTIYSRDGLVKAPTFKVEQLDATGAGDCFDGAFLASLLQGKNLYEAACNANAAGALNAAAFGPMEGRISPETVAALISGENS